MSDDIRARYEAAPTFEEFLATAQDNVQFWESTYRIARVPGELVERLRAVGGEWHLLVLSEDWCGDAVNTVPYIVRLVEQVPNVDVRILARDRNLDIMDAHLTGGTARAIPIAILYDADFVEHGWWGPRPAALQAWVTGPEGQALDKDASYKEIRRWYARDRGVTTVSDIVGLIERGAEVVT